MVGRCNIRKGFSMVEKYKSLIELKRELLDKWKREAQPCNTCFYQGKGCWANPNNDPNVIVEYCGTKYDSLGNEIEDEYC